MTAAKRKISISLGPDIVEELEADDESLSTQMTPCLVLDAEAVSRLAQPGHRAEVEAAMTACLRLGRDVVTGGG